MTTLASLQASFQRHVLEGDRSLLDLIAPPRKGDPRQRAAIYADAYRLRLREALASNYPRLQELLGENAFAQVADAYIEAHPSAYRSIRWFGHALPASLRAGFPHQPWLAELGEWEWALAAAFDAADAPAIAAHDLSSVSAHEWPALRFGLHPSMRCLRMRTNAPQIFKALVDDADVPAPAETEETFWLISRVGLVTRYRSMAASEITALDSLLRGSAFATMCTTLCDWIAPEETALYAAQLLRAWIEEGFVCKIIRAAESEDR